MKIRVTTVLSLVKTLPTTTAAVAAAAAIAAAIAATIATPIATSIATAPATAKPSHPPPHYHPKVVARRLSKNKHLHSVPPARLKLPHTVVKIYLNYHLHQRTREHHHRPKKVLRTVRAVVPWKTFNLTVHLLVHHHPHLPRQLHHRLPLPLRLPAPPLSMNQQLHPSIYLSFGYQTREDEDEVEGCCGTPWNIVKMKLQHCLKSIPRACRMKILLL